LDPCKRLWTTAPPRVDNTHVSDPRGGLVTIRKKRAQARVSGQEDLLLSKHPLLKKRTKGALSSRLRNMFYFGWRLPNKSCLTGIPMGARKSPTPSKLIRISLERCQSSSEKRFYPEYLRTFSGFGMWDLVSGSGVPHIYFFRVVILSLGHLLNKKKNSRFARIRNTR
jgi:hypothetical protein